MDHNQTPSSNGRNRPFAIAPGGAVQARVPPNNGFAGRHAASGARLMPDLPYAKVVQKRIHKVISHAGRSPVVPRIQCLKGEREYPALSSRLTAVSAKTTPNRATTEERSAERGKGLYSGPTDDGSNPRKAINQAGKSAMSPTSQYCRGRQLETHVPRYGIPAAVPNNPRTPRIMENSTIPSCTNLTTLELSA